MACTVLPGEESVHEIVTELSSGYIRGPRRKNEFIQLSFSLEEAAIIVAEEFEYGVIISEGKQMLDGLCVHDDVKRQLSHLRFHSFHCNNIER